MRARLAAVDQGMALPPPVPAAGAPSVPRDRAFAARLGAGDRLLCPPATAGAASTVWKR